MNCYINIYVFQIILPRNKAAPSLFAHEGGGQRQTSSTLQAHQGVTLAAVELLQRFPPLRQPKRQGTRPGAATRHFLARKWNARPYTYMETTKTRDGKKLCGPFHGPWQRTSNGTRNSRHGTTAVLAPHQKVTNWWPVSIIKVLVLIA